MPWLVQPTAYKSPTEVGFCSGLSGSWRGLPRLCSQQPTGAPLEWGSVAGYPLVRQAPQMRQKRPAADGSECLPACLDGSAKALQPSAYRSPTEVGFCSGPSHSASACHGLFSQQPTGAPLKWGSVAGYRSVSSSSSLRLTWRVFFFYPSKGRRPPEPRKRRCARDSGITTSL